jgi:hypothetical protein
MPIDDPRVFPDAALAPPYARSLHELAQASLSATTGQVSAALDAQLATSLLDLLHEAHSQALATAFASAPSSPIYRHLWRLLAQAVHAPAVSGGVGRTLFAVPVVIVAGIDGAVDGRAQIPGVLPDAQALAAILRAHGALSGNQNFALADALVSAAAIDLPRLPALLQAVGDDRATPPDLPPAPMTIGGGPEGVHLRFLIGTAVAAPGVNLLCETGVGAWGLPFTRALTAQLALPGVSVLTLPRAPQDLLAALAQGFAAHREVGAQVFASNAIRKFRASVGEPTAVISAHRGTPPHGAPELRLSLSSPFAPREAEGFRCPLYPLDRIPDVEAMLVGLLRDCRIDDVRLMPGVHPDRSPDTGGPLLFKGEDVSGAAPAVH